MIDRRKEFWSEMEQLRNRIAAEQIEKLEKLTMELFQKYNLEIVVEHSLHNPVEKSVAIDSYGNIYAEWCSWYK